MSEHGNQYSNGPRGQSQPGQAPQQGPYQPHPQFPQAGPGGGIPPGPGPHGSAPMAGMSAPKKKKKWLPWVAGGVGVLVVGAALNGGGGNDSTTTAPPATPAVATMSAAAPATTQAGAPATTQAPAQAAAPTQPPAPAAPAEPEVPAEYKAALRKAQSYSDMMHMSKKGLYKQLTSEYGEKFDADAAQYAVDNVKADWNKNALEKARSYRDTLDMSKEAIRDQLTSEYGEQFTAAQADYAIKNL